MTQQNQQWMEEGPTVTHQDNDENDDDDRKGLIGMTPELDLDVSSFDTHFGLLTGPLICVYSYSSARREVLLAELDPSYVILYDTEPRFVRQLEVLCNQFYLSTMCILRSFSFRSIRRYDLIKT
jgi:hypothetical protein